MLFTISAKEKIFQPPFVLLISIAAAFLYFLYAGLRFSGDKLFNQYYYVMPIIAVFVIFLLDRAERFRLRRSLQWLIDAAVVLTAMWRVIGDVPFVSGHTLFLTYCFLTVNSRVGRIAAMIVLTETLYLKFFVWNDFTSAAVGIVLGLTAALIEKRSKPD
jgi:hypothetical protein